MNRLNLILGNYPIRIYQEPIPIVEEVVKPPVQHYITVQEVISQLKEIDKRLFLRFRIYGDVDICIKKWFKTYSIYINLPITPNGVPTNIVLGGNQPLLRTWIMARAEIINKLHIWNQING